MKSWCDLEQGKPISSHICQRPFERFCREGSYGNLPGTQPMSGRCLSSAWVFHWAYGRSLWMAINTGKNLGGPGRNEENRRQPWRVLWKLSVCWFVFVKTFVCTDSVSSFWQILPPTIGLTASRRVSVALLMRKNLQWNKWKATSPIPKMNFGDQYRRRRFFHCRVDRIPSKVKGCTRIEEAYIEECYYGWVVCEEWCSYQLWLSFCEKTRRSGAMGASTLYVREPVERCLPTSHSNNFPV